jgi:hypothetical protein
MDVANAGELAGRSRRAALCCCWRQWGRQRVHAGCVLPCLAAAGSLTYGVLRACPCCRAVLPLYVSSLLYFTVSVPAALRCTHVDTRPSCWRPSDLPCRDLRPPALCVCVCVCVCACARDRHRLHRASSSRESAACLQQRAGVKRTGAAAAALAAGMQQRQRRVCSSLAQLPVVLRAHARACVCVLCVGVRRFERMPPWWYWFSVINPLRWVRWGLVHAGPDDSSAPHPVWPTHGRHATARPLSALAAQCSQRQRAHRYAWTALLINQFEDNDVMFLGSQTILVRGRGGARCAGAHACVAAAAAAGSSARPVHP